MSLNRKLFGAGLVIIVFGIILGYLATLNHYIMGKNYIKYLQESVGKQLVVQKELKVSYDNKNFEIILCTPVGGLKSETYVQVYEKKMNGLFYEPTYGAEKGESRSLYGMIISYTRDGSDNNFIVVYGYNKDLKAKTYEVKKLKNNIIIKENISDEEYFLQTFQDIVYPRVTFRDKNNQDISKFFE